MHKGFPHSFRTLASVKLHIACLQETHFTTRSTPKFFSSSYPQVYTASASSKSRAVLMALHSFSPFTLLVEIKDPEGSYLILTGDLLDSEITIASYYAPNKNQIPFLSHLQKVIDTHKRGTLLVCGNSNQVLYPSLDKSPVTLSTHPTRPSANTKTIPIHINCSLGSATYFSLMAPLPFSFPHPFFLFYVQTITQFSPPSPL